jgi:hypothetical protein
MIVPESTPKYHTGYALLGEIKNNTKMDVLFYKPIMHIDYEKSPGVWEKIYSDVFFLGMYNKGFFPYELHEMSSFKKYDKNQELTKGIFNDLALPLSEYNQNQLDIRSVSLILIKADSTLLTSRSIDDYLEYHANWFKTSIKKGNYRFYYTTQTVPQTIVFKDKDGQNKKVEIPSKIGDFNFISSSTVTSDTLFVKVW